MLERFNYEKCLVIIALTYAGFFIANNLLNFWTFTSALIDLGTFDQVLWMASNLTWPTTSINFLGEQRAWLGFHFAPLIFILTPLYWIIATPEWLQIIHNLAISLTSILIFHACLRFKVNKLEAFCWSIIYLITVNTLYGSLWEFHEQSLAVPLMVLAVIFIIDLKLLYLSFCLLALVLTKENYGLTVAAFGMFYSLYHKEYKIGSIIFLAGIISFTLIIFFIMPYLNNNSPHPMLITEYDQPTSYRHWFRYSWLKWELNELLGHILVLLSSVQNLGIYIFLLLPLLFTPLVGWIFIIPTLPELAIYLLSDFANTRMIATYYYTTITPLFVIAACYGSQLIAAKFYKYIKKGQIACGSLILSSILVM